MDVGMLKCPICILPFEPPIFQGGHIGCGRCVGELPDNGCKKCEKAAMDAVMSAAMVRCPNVGCGSLATSNEAHGNYIAYQYGPCACTDAHKGYAFSGSLLELLVHLSADHSFRVYKFKYSIPAWYWQRAPERPPGHMIIGYGDEDGGMYGLTIGTLGPLTVVSCVCIRLVACLWPRYTVQLMSMGPPAPARTTDFSTDIVSAVIEPTSTSTPGAVAFNQLTSFLMVSPRYMRDAGPYLQLPIFLYFDKNII